MCFAGKYKVMQLQGHLAREKLDAFEHSLEFK